MKIKYIKSEKLLHGICDFENEINKEQIEEDIKKLQASIERREKLLANENYVNKAPKNIVDMDREKLKEEQEKLLSLQSQL